MGHLPIILGLTFFWAAIVVLAAIGYALLQLLFEMVDMCLTLGFGLYGVVRNWRNMDPDDWVGCISLIVFALIMVAFCTGWAAP